MSQPRRHALYPYLLAIVGSCGSIPTGVHAQDALGGEIVIEAEDPDSTGGDVEIIVDDAAGPYEAGGDVLIIDETAGPATTGTIDGPTRQTSIDLRIDDLRAEYGHLPRSGSSTDNTLYGKMSASANWQASPAWEFQLAGRVDGYDEDGSRSFSTVKADYGDSFVRYRGDNIRLTAGAQTVIWGRMDELPLSDRVSTPDLTRFVLDDLEDRRRANPMIRAETFVAGGMLDLVWLVDFRPAELPHRDSIWYPIDTQRGRILGIDPGDIPPAAVQGAMVSEDEPDGDGGFGARYTRTHSFADIGVTVARTRQATPYFRAAGAGRFEAEYPRSWAYGIDAALDAAGATWRFELVYGSDTPVTRTDLSYTTTASLNWGAGAEFHPGDGDTRVNLQIIGMNLIDAPSVIDRADIYSFNGEIESPFDRGRWRAELDFYAGLGDKDIYLNPELAFLGWEPHEFYVALHYFAGDDDTVGGFHEDHSSINIGWRASF